MRLTLGSRLGPYEIVAPLGAGGMGEVYRARDARLRRDVAIKVLPAAVAGDAERLARFEREAQVLASLSHPNIAAAFGLEQDGEVRALVLEFVSGPTLAEVLARGPMPVDEALAVARQVADALDAAHERGIVHRDLKPDNIKIAANGRVKVLDFGLAKAVASSPNGGLDAAESPTFLPTSTQAGVLLGTACYMAPEQARGQMVDKRADIWAFGCVLFEMLAGRRPFDGPTTTDALAAVLNAPLDISALPEATPPSVRRLIARCLQRDPRQRLRDIADAGMELQWLAERDPSVEQPGASPGGLHASRGTRPRVRRWLAPLLGLAALVALGAALWGRGGLAAPRDAAREPIVTFVVQPPPDREFLGDGTDFEPDFAVSPDGHAVAFTAEDAAGQRDIWVRRLSSLASERVPGSEGGHRPFWSPDSQSVAFFANRAIVRAPLGGGAPQVVCSTSYLPRPQGSWGTSGLILYPEPDGIAVVPAAGGTPRTVLKDRDVEHATRDPVFLPDGRHFLYLSVTPDTSRRAVYLGSLDGQKPTLVLPTVAKAEYIAPGYLAFARGRSLVARPFDPATGRVSGEPIALVNQMAVEPIPGHACYSASAAGVIAYRTVNRQVVSRLQWMDRGGRILEAAAAQAADVDVSLSPDRRLAAVSRQAFDTKVEERPPTNIWILDLARKLSTRWTLQPGEGDESPVWSPDGTELVFAAHRDPAAPAEVRRQSAHAASGARVIAGGPHNFHPADWSSDGRSILLHGNKLPSEELGLWILPAAGGEPQPFAQEEWEESEGRFSPDARWVAYVSNESGRREVYVRPFPAGDARWQVSSDGGAQPLWRRDGKEIFYVAPDGTLMAAAVSVTGAGVTPGRPRPLFREPSLRMNNSPVYYGGSAGYAVSADGTRFLVNRLVHEPRPDPITIVLHAVPGR